MKQKSKSRTYWFSSDLHIAHTNVIHLSKRPFKNVEEMEQTIIANFNKLVKPDDVLYLLGDVSLGKKDSWIRFLDSLVCKNVILVVGNHDKWASIPKDMVLGVFEVVRIRMHRKTFLLSHYPYRCSIWRVLRKRLHPSTLSKKRPKDTGLWLLHGHDHRATQLVDYHPRMFSVGVDANNFKPISIDEIISIIQKKEKTNVKKETRLWLTIKKISTSLHSKIIQMMSLWQKLSK
jgi:calcineurin-like phosphoesterase family protein